MRHEGQLLHECCTRCQPYGISVTDMTDPEFAKLRLEGIIALHPIIFQNAYCVPASLHYSNLDFFSCFLCTLFWDAFWLFLVSWILPSFFQDKRQWAQTRTQKVPSVHREAFSVLCG